MFFCRECGMQMQLIRVYNNEMQAFSCNSCPYIFHISNTIITNTKLSGVEKKRVDDVLGGSDAWENVDSIDVSCPKCEHGRAYYMQIQIRSADEPSSIFYKCCSCGYQWREG